MTRPRQTIIYDGCLAHVIWRCVNRSHFLKPPEVKSYIRKVWAENKREFEVKIFEYIIMDNHVHLLVHIGNAVGFSKFMQVCNSKIAKFINRHFDKRDGVIADRFLSPVIENDEYALRCIEYIWANSFRAGILPAKGLKDFIFCSLYRRTRRIKDDVVDSYRDLAKVAGNFFEDEQSDCVLALRMADSLITRLLDGLRQNIRFVHLHSVGSAEFVSGRRKRFVRGPP